MPMIDVPTVHAVTDDRVLADPDFADRAQGVLRALGPRVAVHLRSRGLPAGALYRLAVVLAPMESTTGGWVVVNDRVDVARAAGVRAVQLGRLSLSVRDAVAVAPSLAFGVSVHGPEAARRAIGSGPPAPDWLLAGNVYTTESHPGRRGGGLALIEEVAATGARVIAIGGVLPGHVPELRQAGAWGVAAIRGIWDQSDPAAAAAQYL